jgi:hypothetical protein
METQDVTRTEFWPVARALQLRMTYEENIRNLHVPRNRRELTIDTAKWFLRSSTNANRPSQLLHAVTDMCSEYVDIYHRKI